MAHKLRIVGGPNPADISEISLDGVPLTSVVAFRVEGDVREGRESNVLATLVMMAELDLEMEAEVLEADERFCLDCKYRLHLCRCGGDA